MKTLLTTTLLVITFALQAQTASPRIVFDKTAHDFGTINEADGKVSYRFSFTNAGAQPLVITRVQPTCGCTTSNYTKEPVQTNQKGFIEAVFDPSNRPGPFSKSIMVSTNGDPATVTITIHGNVVPKPRSIEDDYPLQIGDLRLQNTQFSFFNITNAEVVSREIAIINIGKEPISVKVKDLPAWITIVQVPEVLQPNQKGVLRATMDGSKVNDFGFFTHRVYLLINNKEERNNMISISATIKEDFSKLTPEERANAPKITFNKTEFDVGQVKAGEVVKYDFVFKNEGKSPLIIRKVRTGCGCTASTPPADKIKPGETSSIKVTFNTHGRKGRQAQYIDVYCNDPASSEVKLKLSCTVVE